MDKLFERPLLALLVFALLLGLAVLPDIGNRPTGHIGTDYVGMPATFDGKSYYCASITSQGFCDSWEDVADSATDVASAFGPNMLGIAKGEEPLLEGDEFYVPILNSINTTVFSISMSLNIAVFAVLMFGVLIAGTVMVFGGMVLTRSWPPFKVVLAMYALPGYVSFLSLSSLSGGAAAVIGVHACVIPLIGIGFVFRILGGISLVHSSSVNMTTGDSTTTTLVGKPAEKFGSQPGGGVLRRE